MYGAETGSQWQRAADVFITPGEKTTEFLVWLIQLEWRLLSRCRGADAAAMLPWQQNISDKSDPCDAWQKQVHASG